jgi:hypothetical protein
VARLFVRASSIVGGVGRVAEELPDQVERDVHRLVVARHDEAVDDDRFSRT